MQFASLFAILHYCTSVHFHCLLRVIFRTQNFSYHTHICVYTHIYVYIYIYVKQTQTHRVNPRHSATLTSSSEKCVNKNSLFIPHFDLPSPSICGHKRQWKKQWRCMEIDCVCAYVYVHTQGKWLYPRRRAGKLCWYYINTTYSTYGYWSLHTHIVHLHNRGI